MAYTQTDMHREAPEWLKRCLPELDPEERVEGPTPEQRPKGLEPEERLTGLAPDDVLGRYDPATVEAWLAKQRRDH
ncbi:hypothetical protein [Thiohalocapsa marina]|uniref:hypothetical protein n=1 Tax=Thiohalocapsa marina TaxID=424902 RepID=UPI0036DD77B1